MGEKIKNQNYNDQETEEEKKWKNAIGPHSKQEECKKNDLISNKDRSHPSKQ